LAISGIVAGILQSFNLFFAYALSPIMYNVGIISGALFFAPRWGIKGLAIGVVLGSLLHLLIQIPSLASVGYKYRFHINLKDKMMKKIVKLTIPRSLGLATIQLNTIVITAIASTLTIGSIAIFNYANDIQYVPLGLIGIAYATATFPALSAAFAKKDLKSFRLSVIKALLEIVYLVIPATILFFLLRNEITNVLLRTGEFGSNEVNLTAALIGIFCIGIPFQSLIPLFSRAFFALHNTITPVIINLISVGVNISLALFLVKNSQILACFNIPGDKRILALPLAFSLAGILNVVLLVLFLLKKIGSVSIKKVFNSFTKFVGLNLILFFLVYFIRNFSYQYFDQENVSAMFFVGLIAGGIGLLAYFSLSYVLKIKELKSILKVFKKQNRQRTNL
jgi:putative peptidoglycan lipid II flippase